MSQKMNYYNAKASVNLSPLPCAILAVEKKPDGTCGEITFFAVNEIFERDFYSLFPESESAKDEKIEGLPYYAHMQKEPKFEDLCFRAAWKGEHFNTYIDTTMMYGYWTENITLPICNDEETNIGYCQFMYSLNKEMDTGKFSQVSPDIASFIIKTCLELRNHDDYYSSMDTITRDIREYTDSFATCITTISPDEYKFDVVSECVRNNELCIKELFSKIPYEVVETWEALCGETNCIIIKNETDMDFYDQKAPAWVATLRENDVHSLILVPFVHQNNIIGYLYITNFDISQTERLKETIELITIFLAAETANHMIMEKLEYLSNIDMLTGVYNRNSMNVNVDELSTKLKLNPAPFSVAFCDLNGLKSINDNNGHENGDQLLKDAAKALKDIFADDKIYRAGGDEFTIISVGCTKEEFDEKIKRLRDIASDPDWLYFAIGSYHDDKKGNLRLAMRYADEEMYKDKDKFYEKYPNKRR
ncbi:MAG: GGDEF domain-containing protein [Butyrivibrio sp.]|nr:GGDEF domain-containing protein [Butyrivibrio sp.]